MSKKHMDALREAFGSLTREEIVAALKTAMERQEPTPTELVTDAVVRFMTDKTSWNWGSQSLAQRALTAFLVRGSAKLPAGWPTRDAEMSECLLEATVALSERGIELRSQKRLSGDLEFELRKVQPKQAAQAAVAEKTKPSVKPISPSVRPAKFSPEEAETLARDVYKTHGPKILYTTDFVKHARATDTFASITLYSGKMLSLSVSSALRQLTSRSYGGYQYSMPLDKKACERVTWQVLQLREEREDLPAKVAPEAAEDVRLASKGARKERPHAKKLVINPTDLALAVEAGASLGPGEHTPADLAEALDREGLFRDELAGRGSMGRSLIVSRILRHAADKPPSGYNVQIRSTSRGTIFWTIVRTGTSMPPKAEAPAQPEVEHVPTEAKTIVVTGDAVDALSESDEVEIEEDPSQAHKLIEELPSLARVSLLHPIVIFGGLVEPRKLEWARSTMLNIEWMPTHRDHGNAQAQSLSKRILDHKIGAVIFLNNLFGHRNYQPVMNAARVRNVKVAYAGKGGQGALRSALQNLEAQLAGEEPSTNEAAR